MKRSYLMAFFCIASGLATEFSIHDFHVAAAWIISAVLISALKGEEK